MGLDGVELVMAVEEEFKVALSDSDAMQCYTVGQLVDLIYSRLRHNPEDPCPSQHGFYIVRRQMMSLMGLTRSQVKPDTSLEDLIGKPGRLNLWRELIKSLTDQKTTWPRLVRPRWMNLLVLLAIPLTACICLLAFTWLPFAGAFPLAVAIGFIGDRLTVPFKRRFPAKFSKVKDLIRFVKTLDSKAWTKDEVFQKVKVITVEQLGVKESQVTREANFVKDLGLQ